jgi:signal transduction histidine kinase
MRDGPPAESRSPEARGCLVTDAAALVRDASDSALALLGMSREALLGKPLILFFGRDDQRDMLARVIAARGSSAPQEWRACLAPHRGHPLDVQITLSAAAIPRPRSFALHWEFESSQVTSPPQPLTPSPPLAEDELFRRTLLSAISHELLTPLAIVQGHAEALRGLACSPDPARVDAGLVVIEEQARRLRRLVRNLIDAARASSGTLPIEPVPLQLGPVVARIVAEFQPRSRRHVFASVLPPKLPAVLADQERIEGVLYNLLDNALKYSPGGGRVVVRADVALGDVGLSVSDSGVGIAPDDRLQVFEPYYRALGDPSSAVSGSGLGLFLCRTVVEAHGGRIWVESTPGQGTCVSFTLPRAEMVAATPAALEPSDGATE